MVILAGLLVAAYFGILSTTQAWIVFGMLVVWKIITSQSSKATDEVPEPIKAMQDLNSQIKAITANIKKRQTQEDLHMKELLDKTTSVERKD